MKLKTAIGLILSTAIAVLSISSCAPLNNERSSKNDLSGSYVFVAKDIQNQYMLKVYEGFFKACSENDMKAAYLGPNTPSVQQQIDIIDNLVKKKVAGIAIAANDADALEEPLKKAMSEGIKVISLDSSVNKNSRQMHIEQADPEQIGRTLMQTANELVNGKGGIAILSTTRLASNQNIWIRWMNKEISDHPGKYANTPIVKTVYGDDDPDKSETEVRALLNDSSIDVIIAPTTVGSEVAARVIRETKSSVKLTGLGLPSKMATYILDDTCKKIYLWDPRKIGYLAGYSLKALSDGSVTGAVGDTFAAGELGEKTVTADKEGGTEVILGAPITFDLSNIDEWQDKF